MAEVSTEEAFKELKCCSCGCYLSVDPSTAVPNGYKCGRCFTIDYKKNSGLVLRVGEYNFPCRYDSDGCKAKLPFGEEILEHENACGFRNTGCLLIDTCEWKGKIVNVMEHCVEKHPENVLNSLKVSVNLELPTDKKYIIKMKSGDVLLLHLKYSSDSHGLSATILDVSCIYDKQLMNFYDLVLKSSDNKNVCDFKQFENGKCIPKAVLDCVDKKKVSVQIELQLYIPGKEKEVCFLCKKKLLYVYVLKCENYHYFCEECCKADNSCSICSTTLMSIVNCNMKDEYKEWVFNCSNVKYGCKFSGVFFDLKTHEEKCKSYKCCVIENCKWRGDVINHFQSVHSDKFLHTSTVKFSTLCGNSTYILKKNIPLLGQIMIVLSTTYNSNKSLEVTVNSLIPYQNIFFRINLLDTANKFENTLNSLLSDGSLNMKNNVCICQDLYNQNKSFEISFVRYF